MGRRMYYYCFVAVFIIVLSITIVMRADAGEKKIPNNVFKCYKVVEVKEGDTLWKLADIYSDSKYISKSDYVEEIKKINNIRGDIIHSGNYLTISYYECNNINKS